MPDLTHIERTLATISERHIAILRELGELYEMVRASEGRAAVLAERLVTLGSDIASLTGELAALRSAATQPPTTEEP
jgi:hypothetical protein